MSGDKEKNCIGEPDNFSKNADYSTDYNVYYSKECNWGLDYCSMSRNNNPAYSNPLKLSKYGNDSTEKFNDKIVINKLGFASYFW